ncbi:hypothetical protein [Pyxidicoccus xibeiensis]|uniref:hypothetical protein n=1 Tax=Pyxidicoccus xibeiensis TaxID=2906759 RepID=UPI0020A70422|nr:hypothetical protein [Pyxidicoccus xibeiensis]MCP3143072.1 hypothetical protein [Pyxidicoccus xibeiensis]
MSGARGWTWLALLVGALGLGCERGEGLQGPSAGEREGRSEVLRELMASREPAPDPESLKGPDAMVQEPTGQGGSGRPEPTGSVQGHVTWVGDNELLIRDLAGVERDLEVNPGTRILLKGKSLGLGGMWTGDEVRVSYDEGPGGWVAREVEVLPRPEPEVLPNLRETPQGRARPGAEPTPPR